MASLQSAWVTTSVGEKRDKARQSVTPRCLKGQARTKQSHGLHSSSTISLLISPLTPKGQLGPTKSGMLVNIVLFWTAWFKLFLLSVFQKKRFFLLMVLKISHTATWALISKINSSGSFHAFSLTWKFLSLIKFIWLLFTGELGE